MKASDFLLRLDAFRYKVACGAEHGRAESGRNPERGRRARDAGKDLTLEKCEFLDQKSVAKFATIDAFIRTHPDMFLRQGSVAAGWRNYRDHRLGPFFSLRYRVKGRQRAIYLGQSAELAERVRTLLAEMAQKRAFALDAVREERIPPLQTGMARRSGRRRSPPQGV